MSIDFRQSIEAIDNNRLIIIHYVDYIDCLPMIDFHQVGTPCDKDPLTPAHPLAQWADYRN